MGVRGLTTYIAKRSDRYLKLYRLHGCFLVVDGNSLASQLYNLRAACNCSFGGDYDRYANCVAAFFDLLRKCDVTPLVVFDGGYELRKIRTVCTRLKNKICLAKCVTPVTQSKSKFFPLFMKEVFKDVLRKLNIPFAQSLHEADDEVAAIARRLECPVLSYDSDFYIYDVLYIPFTTLQFEPSKYEDSDAYFINCCIYRVENFLNSFGGLQKSLLPLMATLLGNDYVNRSMFNNFFSQIKWPKSRVMNETQKRIAGLLDWLRKETLESAISKIMGHIKKSNRPFLAQQIKKVVSSYVQCSSDLLTVLALPEVAVATIDSEELERNFLKHGQTGSDDSTLEGNSEESCKNIAGKEAEVAVATIDSEELERNFLKHGQTGSNDSTLEDNSEESCKNIAEKKAEEVTRHDIDMQEEEMEDESEESSDEYELCPMETTESDDVDTDVSIPEWFKSSFKEGHMPSYFMDILTLRVYFCPPQVEDYSLPHAHTICLPIIKVIFGLLTMGGTAEEQPLIYYARNYHGYPEKFSLSAIRETSTVRFPLLEKLPDLQKVERERLLLEAMQVRPEDMEVLASLPSKWRLFMLAVLFWARQAPIDSYHLHALLFSLVTLNVVDGQAGYYRSKKILLKENGNVLKRLVKARSAITTGHSTDGNSNSKNIITALDSVSKDDCLLLVETLLPFHQMEVKLKSSPKLYSVSTVHAFAQFQCCLAHAMHLNALLSFPLPQCQVASFFSGTLVYNAYKSFKKRTDINTYIAHLLGHAPTVHLLYKTLAGVIQACLPHVTPHSRSKGKRHKKKSKHKHSRKAERRHSEESENSSDVSEMFTDNNNRFVALCSDYEVE